MGAPDSFRRGPKPGFDGTVAAMVQDNIRASLDVLTVEELSYLVKVIQYSYNWKAQVRAEWQLREPEPAALSIKRKLGELGLKVLTRTRVEARYMQACEALAAGRS